jgi:cob(I)alamin adenosyltransferase
MRPRGRQVACGAVVKIYTRKGDDGTTGLYFGGARVAKDSAAISVNGDVDEAQAMLGLARAEAGAGSELDEILLELERDLWVLMAEVATAAENRHKLVAGATLVTDDMVRALEFRIDALNERFEMPKEFVVPGQNRVSAALDVARTIVRRAERGFTGGGLAPESGSYVGPYLNRLSDLVWTMARWQEGEHIASRSLGHAPGAADAGASGTSSSGSPSSGAGASGAGVSGAGAA